MNLALLRVFIIDLYDRHANFSLLWYSQHTCNIFPNFNRLLPQLLLCMKSHPLLSFISTTVVERISIFSFCQPICAQVMAT